MEDLRDKNYFSQRATLEMAQHLCPKHRTLKETLAQACRIIALHEGEAGLAGQISARSDCGKGHYWTLRFGLGFDEATPDDFIEVDQDLHTVSGVGMANPATRFHLWVYESRPDVNSIVHTHSPCVSALAAAKQPLGVCQMDMTPFYENCAFLPEWPGLPIADHEGVIISEPVNKKDIVVTVFFWHTGPLRCTRARFDVQPGLIAQHSRRGRLDSSAALPPFVHVHRHLKDSVT